MYLVVKYTEYITLVILVNDYVFISSKYTLRYKLHTGPFKYNISVFFIIVLFYFSPLFYVKILVDIHTRFIHRFIHIVDKYKLGYIFSKINISYC